jgi:hypothetical protein
VLKEVRQPGASGSVALGAIRELKCYCMCPPFGVQPTFPLESFWFRDDFCWSGDKYDGNLRIRYRVLEAVGS